MNHNEKLLEGIFFFMIIENRKITAKKSNSFKPNFKTNIMETTVANVLISYDVDAKNPEVKAALLALNYYNDFTLGTALISLTL